MVRGPGSLALYKRDVDDSVVLFSPWVSLLSVCSNMSLFVCK